jgi:hypothetical protein
MNRVNELREDRPDRRGPGDYFVVSGESYSWYVSTAMAKAIEAHLDAKPRPRWVTFVDLAGSRVRVRTRQIEYIHQCTAEQRSAERAFHQSLKREHKADRSWDEE